MHEREHTHDQATAATSSLADDGLAPGRGSRSSRLAAPAAPIVSALIQRRAARDDNGVADDANVAVTTAASSSGSSLPEPIMRKFESSLGADLSSVRVHTGAESAVAATSVGARAYTTGQNIHFAAGQYDPSSSHGEHLLAHEVAHTVQQRGGAPMRQNKLEVSSPQDAAEHEADRAADAMVTGRSAAISGSAPTVALMRAPRVAMVTLAGSVPSQIGAMQATFHGLMAEADAIIKGIHSHYQYVNSIYAGCFANHQIVIGQAAADEETDKVIAEILVDTLLLASGFGVELKIAGAVLKRIVKAAETVKSLAEIAGNVSKLATPPAMEVGGEGADPSAMHIATLSHVLALIDHVSTVRNDGNVVLDNAATIASVLGQNAPATGQLAPSQDKALIGLRNASEDTLAAAQELLVGLRVLSGRRKVPVPSWRETEQDIWIAWFAAKGSMKAADDASGMINHHLVDLGLWGPVGQPGGRTGLPADFEHRAGVFYSGKPSASTVEIGGGEDESEQKSMPAQRLDMLGMVNHLKSRLREKWENVFLLKD